MPLARGSRIGRYEVVDRLGAGGMGVVYKAHDAVLDRAVAIKLLPPEFVSDPDRLRRFELEARATGRLNHPHILAIFDAVVDGPQPYLVTELLDGETLGRRLLRGPLPPGDALTLTRQVAGALAAAHARGIVHRDLKPDNILISRDGTAKVLDFGLAKVTSPILPADETQTAGTMPGVTLGSVGYMAPEQIEGRPVDHRSDIFSLGIVLHEALTARPPFQRATVVDTLHAIVHDAPPELPPAVPVTVQQIAARCLQKSPDARFQSARDLEFALATALDRSGATPGRTPSLKAPRAALFLAVAGIVLLAALGWTLYRRGGSDSRSAAPAIRSIAVLPLVDLSREQDQAYLADSLTEALITDLSHIRALRVIARTSVMRYKGSKRALRDIASDLGVTGIVEGTVLRAGDRVRVTAHLVNVGSQQQIWGERYDRDFGDILALQSELARTIADRIAVELSPPERARLEPAAAGVRPASHESYLRGRYFWNKRDPVSLQHALEAFQRAIDADPGSARAWAGLADTYFYMGYAFGRMPPTEAMPKAAEAARRALAIDANLADAHATLGLVHLFFDWDRVSAEAQLRRALELNPGNVFARRGLAALLLTGRDPRSAIQESRRAVQLDPVSVAEHFFLALSYFAAGDLSETVRTCQDALHLEPGYGGCFSLIGQVHERRGEPHKAIQSYVEQARLQGMPATEIERRLHAYKTGGMRAFHEAELEGMVKNWDGWHFMAFLIAAKQAETGHRQAAFEWLERAKDARSAGMMLANAERFFEPYRSDPQFRTLLGPAFTGEP